MGLNSEIEPASENTIADLAIIMWEIQQSHKDMMKVIEGSINYDSLSIPFEEKNIEMSTITLKQVYRCYDDCKRSGCPSHIASLTLQNTSMAYTFEDGQGCTYYFEHNALETFVSLLSKMSESDASCVDVGQIYKSTIENLQK